jgi:hypothetical protein
MAWVRRLLVAASALSLTHTRSEVMSDYFWSRIPANAVDPWNSAPMRGLLGVALQEQSRSASDVAPPHGPPFESSISDTDQDALPGPILVADNQYGGRHLPRTEIHAGPSIWHEWRKHAERTAGGIWNWLTEKPARSTSFH